MPTRHARITLVDWGPYGAGLPMRAGFPTGCVVLSSRGAFSVGWGFRSRMGWPRGMGYHSGRAILVRRITLFGLQHHTELGYPTKAVCFAGANLSSFPASLIGRITPAG